MIFKISWDNSETFHVCSFSMMRCLIVQSCIVSQSFEARDSLADESSAGGNRRFTTAIRACILLYPPTTIYHRCSSPVYDSFVSYESSFTLILDISVSIDYASSSLSDVLVSIGDIGVGGTRTFQFSRPELLDFFMPVLILHRILAVQIAIELKTNRTSPES